MPRLIRLYILSISIGFALSAVFLALLVWADVGGLRHLVLETPSGSIAAIMLFVMNGIIFAGVQFGIAVMALADDDARPRGGLRAPNALRLAQQKAAAAAKVAGPQQP